MNLSFEIVWEDEGLLVVNKPAGLLCHPTKPDGHSSLIREVGGYLGPAWRPHLVNRLDRETSGLVVIAKHRRAARLLYQAWENRAVIKEYLALVHGHPVPNDGWIDAPLGPDEASRLAVKDKVRQDGMPAQTRFQVESRFLYGETACAVVRLWPQTGRKHQIRIHLASLGHPVVGDKIYGGDEDCYLAFAQGRLTDAQRARLLLPNQALHALRLQFAWHGTWLDLMAAPNEAWRNFLSNGAGRL